MSSFTAHRLLVLHKLKQLLVENESLPRDNVTPELPSAKASVLMVKSNGDEQSARNTKCS